MSQDKNWVDYKEIKEQVSIRMVLDKYGVKLKESGKSLTSCCPIHKGSNPRQFSVSPEKNAWRCFGNCNTGGNVLDLVALMEYGDNNPESIRQAALLLQNWFNFGSSTEKPTGKKLVREKEISHESDTPKKDPPNDNQKINTPLAFELKNLDPNHEWFQARGLSPETVNNFGLGLQGKGSLAGRIAIPIHDYEDQLVAYCGRAITEEQIEKEGKYKLPVNFQKSQVIYNLHRQPHDQKILILVESFISVWWLYQAGLKNAVALMGSDLSPAQENLIINFFAGRSGGVVLLFDADDSGKKCTSECLNRLSSRLFVKAVDISAHGRKPHQLTPQQLRLFL